MLLIMTGEENYPHQGRRVTHYSLRLDAADRSHERGRWSLSKVGKDTLSDHCRRVTDGNGYAAVSTAVWVEDDGEMAEAEVAFYYGVPQPVNPMPWLQEVS
jgi:hypothetical protein